MNDKDIIYRQAAIDALWKALYEYEDKTEKQFIDSEELDVADWIQHRNFVQNMSDIDRQTILGLPSAQPVTHEERTETHACDLISRQAAISLVKDACNAVMSECESWYDPEVEDEVYKNIHEVDAILKCNKEIRIALRNMPSAEPKIIHCKNCKHRESNDCPMYYEEWIEIDEGDGYFDTDNIIHDWTTDEGFCHCAELRGEEDE